MIEGLARAGVRRVRITGGEPLLHPRAVDLVAFVASMGFDDIALTTNGTRLERLAAPLRAAGLMRLTVSIDSLDEGRFRRITRGGDLDQVLAGVDAALAARFDEVKLNCVVLRDENDDELASITEWAWARGITPRFIELMPIAEGAHILTRHLVTAAEMRVRLSALLEPDEARADADRGPAKYVRAQRDARLRVGFITGTSDTFCDSCDRLRVAADGMLRPCLATDVGVSAKADAEHGDSSRIARAIDEAWKLKPDGSVWKGCTEETAARVSMRAIGG
jgi:cyclic pyranopterin phosphate synthase